MSGRKRAEEAPPAGAPLWMVSYSDVMSVLMAMFVMLYAMSNLDTVKFQEVVISLNGALGVLSGGPGVLYLADLPTTKPTPPETPKVQITPLQVIQQKYSNDLKHQSEDGRIDSEMTAEGLRLRFTDRTLFAPGSATLRPEAAKVLAVVGEMLRENANRISVEGHTDSTPISTPQFPSNWELSTARATAMVHYLIENEGIDPKRLTAAGYGEFWPLVPNDTPERRAFNRRVELTILSEEEHPLGPTPDAQSGGQAGSPAPHPVDLLTLSEEVDAEHPITIFGPTPGTSPDANGVNPQEEASDGGE